MGSNKKYLIGVCAHVNTEKKFKQLIEQLESLMEEGLDVCVSINSTKYLSEIAKYAKYLIYNDDNEFIDQPFYLENADVCHNGCGSIIAHYNCHEFSSYYKVPFRGHSKPALKLWINSFYIAWQNGYEWICHTEYDVKTPTMGWKKYIENTIQTLEETNNKALYYTCVGHLWGNLFVLNSSVCKSTLLQNTKNINTKRDWIKYWGTAVAETCLTSIINDEFKESIITKPIHDSFKEIWEDISDPDEAQQSSKTILEEGTNRLVINEDSPEVVHIYPVKIDSGYDLYLLKRCISSVEILNTQIMYDGQIIYNNPCVNLHSFGWYLFKLPPYDNVKIITLLYEKKIGKTIISYTESFSTENIKNICNYLINLIPNSSKI